MNTLRIWIFLFITLGALSQVSTVKAQLQIERLQREFQARYFFLTSNYVQWPGCNGCGDDLAPKFPKDGYYGDISLDRALGYKLVTNIVQHWFDDENLCKPINEYFVQVDAQGRLLNAPTTLLDASSYVVTYIDYNSINAHDYHQDFDVLYDNILKLTHVLIDDGTSGVDPCDGTPFPVNGIETSVIQIGNAAPTPEIKKGSGTSGESGEEGCNDVKLLAMSSYQTSTPIAVDKIQAFIGIPGYPNCEYITDKAARLEVAPGYIQADLRHPRYKGGKGYVYLEMFGGVEHVEFDISCDDFDGMEQFADDGMYSFFPAPVKPGSANMYGGLWESSPGNPVIATGGDIFTEEALAPFTGNEQGFSWPSCGHGINWKIMDQFIAFAPYFKTDPDDLKECGGCDCSSADCIMGTVTVDNDTQANVYVDFGTFNSGQCVGFASLISKTHDMDLSRELRVVANENPDLAIVDRVSNQTSENFNRITNIYMIHEKRKIDILYNGQSASISFSRDVDYDSGTYTYNESQPFKVVSLNLAAFDLDVDEADNDSGKTRNHEFSWTSIPDAGGLTDRWELDLHQNRKPAGGFSSRIHSSRDYETSTKRTYTSRTVYDGDDDAIGNVVAYQENRTYEAFDWGKELISHSSGSESTSYLYGTNPLLNDYGRLYRSLPTSGPWKEFHYDQYGRKTVEITQFKDETKFDALDNHQITYQYIANETVNIIEEFLLNDGGSNPNMISKQRMEFAYEDPTPPLISQWYDLIQTQLHSPSALTSDPKNLVTTTRYHLNNEDEWRPIKEVRPNGTMTIYSYSFDQNTGASTDYVSSGRPNPGQTAILDGTRIENIINAPGSQTTSIRRTYALQDGINDILMDEDIHSNPDTFGRPQRIDYLDGTYTTRVYGCCGDISSTSKDGTETQSILNDFDQLIGSVNVATGIAITNRYDGAGKTIESIRVGSDNSTVILVTNEFDASGRLIKKYTPSSGLTLITYPTSEQKTQTFSDGSTQTETRYSDGQLKSISGTAAFPMEYDYGYDGTDGRFAKETKLVGTSTTEWTSTFTDFLGRQYLISRAGAKYESTYFDNGQLKSRTDPDGITSLFSYNGEGELHRSVIDINQNGIIDETGSDRIRKTTQSFIDSDPNFENETIEIQTTTNRDESNDDLIASKVISSNNRLKAWQIVFDGPSSSISRKTEISYDRALQRQNITHTFPDNSQIISVFQNGRLITESRLDSDSILIGQTTYLYDAQGRVSSATDARNGATVIGYKVGTDLIESVTTPAPGTGQSAQSIFYYYDSMARQTTHILADGTTMVNEYHPTGLLKKTYGSRTYPVEYVYDDQGRLRDMITWKDFSDNSTTATTSWEYDSSRGWLTKKFYPNPSNGSSTRVTNPSGDVLYLYYPSGRLLEKSGQIMLANYYYNSAGEPRKVEYASTTFIDEMEYDRRGRLIKVEHADSTKVDMTYSDAGQLRTETYTGGPLDGYEVETTYDTLFRRQSVIAKDGATTLETTTYGYDAASRLETVTSGDQSVKYTYEQYSQLVNKIEHKNLGTTTFTTTKKYDKLNRLSSISHDQGNLAFNYRYNNANQRVKVALADGSYWIYLYDELGQVISGKKIWADGKPVPGQKFNYKFDHIGNRDWVENGGDANGGSMRHSVYQSNFLNQYGERTVTNIVDIIGLARGDASLDINGTSGIYRKGEYYQKAVNLGNNEDDALHASVTVSATSGAGNDIKTGNIFVPENEEIYIHDADGNLERDGRWTYTWDDENRLIGMESLSDSPVSSRHKLEFTYDWRGRRIQKLSYPWSVTLDDYDLANPTTTKYVYDGWNIVAEIVDGNKRTYAWGLDLSGNLHAAGGIGGLLILHDDFTIANSPSHHFFAYDGNGNVVALVDRSGNSLTAMYEYNPFGETIRISGPMGLANHYRYSTKYQDHITRMVYFGFRYYSPLTGRWLNRDPINEYGGINLYGFASNEPIKRIDPVGKSDINSPPVKVTGEYINPYGDYSFRLTVIDAAPHVYNFPAQLDSSPAIKPGRQFSTPYAIEERVSPFAYNSLLAGAPHLVGTKVGEQMAAINASAYTVIIPGFNRPCPQPVMIKPHGLRHVPKNMQESVRNAVVEDLAVVGPLPPGQMIQKTIVVGGEKYTYRAFGLPNDKINVGTIISGEPKRDISRPRLR